LFMRKEALPLSVVCAAITLLLATPRSGAG
jgi:hypothetical protein